MTHFIVGEQVSIRYGRQRGQKAKIIKSSSPDAYLVKVEDGSIRFYSGKGLAKASDGLPIVVP